MSSGPWLRSASMSSSQDSSSYELEWDVAPPSHYSRTVANKVQLSVLETLHEKSRGRATRDEIQRASEETGLEVRWIRKWLSRRRCRDKSRTSSASEISLPDSPFLGPGRPSSSILPHFDYLLSTTASSSALPRPAYMRAISAPTLLTTPAYSDYQRPPLLARAFDAPQTPYDRPATAPQLFGYSPAAFALPPLDTLLAPNAHAVSPSLPSGDFLGNAELPTIEYPHSDVPSTGEDLDQLPPTFDVEDALQYPIFFPGSEPQQAPPTPLQTGMLSALGLELGAAPSLDAPGTLAQDFGQRTPAPAEPWPVFFRVRLTDLGAVASGSRESGAVLDEVREASAEPMPPVPDLVRAENASPFSEPDQYIVVGPAEEDEDDEIPTPTDVDASFVLLEPPPRKLSTAPCSDLEGITIA